MTAWFSRHWRFLVRRLKRLWAVIADHHHGSTFALCALSLMTASMVTSITGWRSLLSTPLAYAVGVGVQGFILYLAMLLVAARTRLNRLLLLAVLAGFALCLSVPFSWVAIVAGNTDRAEVAGKEALEVQALHSATAQFVRDGNLVRAQVLTNIANARAWLGRTSSPSTPPPGEILVEELPPGDSAPPPDTPVPQAGPPPTLTELELQRRYLDEMERTWQELPLSPGLSEAPSVVEGWQRLSAAYDYLMVAWGRTRRYLRAEVPLPAVPVRPVTGYAEAAAGTADPINRAFERLIHNRRPADLWLLLLALMLDAAPIWAAWTLSLITPSASITATTEGEGTFETLREDLRQIEERLAESGPYPADGVRYERDATWDFALSLSVQRLFLDALEAWWLRLSEVIEATDADPALEGRLKALRDDALAEEGAAPIRHLRQARWLIDTKRHIALVRDAKDIERDLSFLGPEAVEAAKRRLTALLGP